MFRDQQTACLLFVGRFSLQFGNENRPQVEDI